MSYRYLICVDVAEDVSLDSNNHMWEVSSDRVQRAVGILSRKWPNSTICVYELQEIQKIKEPPKYQRYKCQENGEVVPV